jgi:hypothetical protein
MAVARRAASQHGVVTVDQLRELGLTYEVIRRRVEVGRLHRLYRGVYAVGHRKLSRDGHLRAALYAAGPTAQLSHRTAAGLHGLRALNLRQIEVTVVGANSGRRAGLSIHRTGTPFHRDDTSSINGLNFSSVPRVLVELAPTATESELERLITLAVRRQILTHHKLESALQRDIRRPGIGTLKAAYAAYRPRPDRASNLERAFDRLLVRHPEIPEPVRNFRLGPWELDNYWPEQKVVLELDGRPYHVAVQDMERDRFRDAQLLREGICTLRITDQRFEADPTGSFDDLLAVLGLASGRTLDSESLTGRSRL